MKIIDNVLYLEFSEMIQAGVPENTVKSAKLNNRWSFINDPKDKRRVLIEFEALRENYKKQVQAKFGDPYDYVAKNPIRELVSSSDRHTAEKFYTSFRFSSNESLPIEHVQKYTTAAAWLSMLNRINSDKKVIKKQLSLSLDKFWVHVTEIIKTDNIDLPTSYQRLTSKMKEFAETGYNLLIDWRFGNKLAAKVADEFCESLLLELISHPNQYDDVYICGAYNLQIKSDYKRITPGTVGVWRRNNEHLIIMQREGNAAYLDKFGKHVKGFRPTTPLYLVESDDNHLDLFFLDPSDTTAHKFYHKFKAIVVTDSFNDYVLGYAYAEELTTEVVRAAYANAMYHIKEITSGWYLPHELKTDRWGLKELRPFYSSIGKYFDTPVGSKRRGYIEQFFGGAHWKRAIKSGVNNYSGNNITAANRGVNTEVLNLNKKDYPTIDEAPAQIANFFNRLRLMPQANGKSKQQEWLEAFMATSEEKKRMIGDEQFLLKFGVLHQPKNGSQVKITNGGVETQIRNNKLTYTVPHYLYLQNVGSKVNVIYDPHDMSRVLVTDGNKLRFIANSTQLQPRAMQDYSPGDRTFLNAILAEKRADVQFVSDKETKRRRFMESEGINTEAILQANVMVKELKQSAERNLPATQQAYLIDRDSYDPLDQM